MDNVLDYKYIYEDSAPSKSIEDSEYSNHPSLTLNECHFNHDYQLDMDNYFISDFPQECTSNESSGSISYSKDERLDSYTSNKTPINIQKIAKADSITSERVISSNVDYSKKDESNIRSLDDDENLNVEEISDIHSFLVKKRKNQRKKMKEVEKEKKGKLFINF